MKFTIEITPSIVKGWCGSAWNVATKPLAKETAYATAAGATGAGIGSVVIAMSGLTAAGMVGGGAGIGSAAGPVGTVAGAVTGLAVYGTTRALVNAGRKLSPTQTTNEAPSTSEDGEAPNVSEDEETEENPKP